MARAAPAVFAAALSACAAHPCEVPAEQEGSRLSICRYQILHARLAIADAPAESSASRPTLRPQQSPDAIAPALSAIRFEILPSRELLEAAVRSSPGSGFDSGGQLLRSAGPGRFNPARWNFPRGSFDLGMLDNSAW